MNVLIKLISVYCTAAKYCLLVSVSICVRSVHVASNFNLWQVMSAARFCAPPTFPRLPKRVVMGKRVNYLICAFAKGLLT